MVSGLKITSQKSFRSIAVDIESRNIALKKLRHLSSSTCLTMQLPSFSMPRRPCRTPKPPSAPPVSNFLVFSLEVQKFGDFTNLEDWNVLTSDAAQSYRPITNQSINHHRLPPDQHESKIPDGEAVSQDQTLGLSWRQRVAWFSRLVFSVFSVFSMDLNQKTHRKKNVVHSCI